MNIIFKNKKSMLPRVTFRTITYSRQLTCTY